MIDLLHRITTQQAEYTGVLGARTAQLLEWDRVTGQIAVCCINRRSAAQIRFSRPYTNLDAIRLYHTLSDEMRPAAERNQWPPLIELSGALDLLQQPPPLRFEGPDLVHLASAAQELDRLRDHFLMARMACPTWGEAAVQMSTFTGLCSAIGRALDLDGRIVDNASPLLARLRRSVTGQEQAVRQEMNQALTAARGRGWTTGSEVTLRGDRFCLPMRSGDSRKVPGIVHDRSSTGATLFVEPAGVVRLANELSQTRLEIAAEESRILFELNRAAEEAAPALIEAAEVMLLVDQVRAHLLWSRKVGGRRPTLNDQGDVRICGGRHPLLAEALADGDLTLGCQRVVPLDLEMPKGARALVISGPNAGGKSVALKTVGTFCLLAQCGWDVPAREDTRLPLIDRLLADLGDDQSIAAALSSFSAHLGHLSRFMAEAGPGSLVLCDEIGSGTDPHEGTALAYSVLEKLIDGGAMVLASTHFGLLKAAVHDHPQMVNAAMDYDERDLRPLFTFRVGDPGTSHAFDIAARMGFAEDLLSRAREMAGEERVRIEQLLTDLDRRARELMTQQAHLEQETQVAETRNRELQDRLRGLKKEYKKQCEQIRLEGDDLIKQGRRSIENAVREIRSSQADKTVVRSARDRLAKLDTQLGSEDDTAPKAPLDVKPGQRVRIPHLGLIGSVIEVRGQKLVALADGMRLSLTFDSVRHLDDTSTTQPLHTAQTPSPEASTEGSGSWSWQGEPAWAGHEIDLRGTTGEEGWDRLDQFIDRAIPAGLQVLNVIHGFGTGRLRDYLYKKLKSDDRVASYREAGRGQGGAGATRVTLSED